MRFTLRIITTKKSNQTIVALSPTLPFHLIRIDRCVNLRRSVDNSIVFCKETRSHQNR